MLKTALYRCCAIILVLPACAAAQPEPQPLPVMASEFVQQVLSRGGSPSDVAVTFQNVASIPPDAQDAAQNAILNAFRTANARIVKPQQAIAEVQVAFSEDWQGSVWVAAEQQGSTSQLVIRRRPRPQRGSS